MFRLRIAQLKNRLLRLRLHRRPLSPSARKNLRARDHISLHRMAREYTYVVLDLETTGLDKVQDRIVSIGAVRIKAGRICIGQFFNQFVNPKMKIPAESIKVHGIVPGMVASAPGGKKVIDDFLDYIDNSILIAHHAAFDIHFLNRLMLARHGFPLQNLVLDTLPLCQHRLMSKSYIATQRRKKPLVDETLAIRQPHNYFGLDAITSQLGIHIYQRHTALGDALATAMIFQQVLSKTERAGNGKLLHLVRSGAM